MTAIPKTAASPARSPWILGPWRDSLLIIGSPILVVPLVLLALTWFSAAQVTAFAVLFAMSHHLPGFIRAYGDRELFRRFRTRFLLAPVILLAVTVPATVAGLHSVIFVTMLWGNWHYLAQAYGFGRIYDGRMGRTAQLDARLDKALCLAWFVGTPILFSNATIGFFEGASRSGLPIPSSSALTTIRFITQIVMGAITLLWIGNAIRNGIRGTASSPVKLSMLGTTMLYVWFIAAFPDNVFVAYALFEIFHDTQYLTIVWAINRNRVDKGQEFGGLSRFLFSPGAFRVLFYVGICALYGLVDLGSKQSDSELFRDVMLGVFGASTILHYYFDGFIWRLRDASNSSALGVNGSATKTWFHRPWLKHAALWSIFAIPAGVCLVLESNQRAAALAEAEQPIAGRSLTESEIADRQSRLLKEQLHDRLFATLPDSWELQYATGLKLAQEQKYEEARQHLEESLRLLPDNADAHVTLAGIHLLKNELEDALPHYHAAIATDPHHKKARLFHGRALMELKRYEEAQVEFEAAWRIASDDPEVAYWTGINLRRNKQPRKARKWQQRALAIDPDYQLARQELQSLPR
ncbi:MAG: tetratricopeptide repeat protein [bacterium]|nr:tetratricopeptide repeat protein [bacterium]